MSDLDDFYVLIDDLRRRVGGERLLGDCHGRQDWPTRGVYFFFEPGETRASGSPRVVRVGTHALKAGSKTSLWTRLSQHRGHVGGSRAGGGNHRGSVFRLHIGECLLGRDGDPLKLRDSWGRPIASSADESLHELAVSSHIRAMPFLFVPVLDEAGPTSARATVEAGAIALLSARCNPGADPASSSWLGQWSTRAAIRQSGLWNVQHVDGPPVDFLPILAAHVAAIG